MPPELEIILFIFFTFILLCCGYLILNNSRRFAKWVQIFRFKSDEEILKNIKSKESMKPEIKPEVPNVGKKKNK